MSTVAETARLGRSGRARRGERTSPRLLAGGVLWIVVFAGLLAGVVAVNVAVLRLNLQLDSVGHERTQLKADIAELQSELSNRASTFETERAARDELGLVQADPDQTVFIRLPAK
jgi:cell division protein FtsL